MAVVRLRCSWCRATQDLKPDRITLHHENDGWLFRFACLACKAINWKRANDTARRQLTGMGVRIVVPTPHPEDPPDGPLLTVQDVHDFVIDLETSDWWVELDA